MTLEDYKDILDKVDEILPPKDCIAFEFSDDFTDVFDDKLGGIPYFPKDMEYPTHKVTKEPLALLVQLNFNTFKHIPNYPDHGILQIYISNENSYYGMNFDDYTNDTAFRVIYHENIIEDTSKLIDTIPYDTEGLPYEKEYKLIPTEPFKMYASMNIEEFGDVFVDAYNELRNDKITDSFDIPNDMFNLLCERNERHYMWIGGYPTFTQSDPRNGTEYSVYDTILLASDTYSDEYDFMWGDAGTAKFFIKEEDLKNLNFNDILFSWDCC